MEEWWRLINFETLEYSGSFKGLKRGCIMFPWLFNVFFVRMVRQVKEKMIGKPVELCDERGRRGDYRVYKKGGSGRG